MNLNEKMKKIEQLEQRIMKVSDTLKLVEKFQKSANDLLEKNSFELAEIEREFKALQDSEDLNSQYLHNSGMEEVT